VVVFVADGTRGTMSATIGEDGSYRVENVPSGPVKIAVKTAAPSRQPPPAQTKAWEGDKMPEKFRQQKSKAGGYLWLPEKYGDPEKSGLTLQVRGGSQDFDIQLEGPAQSPGQGAATPNAGRFRRR
jgi:hypothetical protein